MVAPPGVELWPDSTQVAISPDGQYVAFVSGNPIDRQNAQLWVRAIDSLTAKPLEGTAGATLPFWKPDSSRIGFFAGTKLKSIPVGGGRADVDRRHAVRPRRHLERGRRDRVCRATRAACSAACRPTAATSSRLRRSTRRARKSATACRCFCRTAIISCSPRCRAHDGKFNIFAGSLSDPARHARGCDGQRARLRRTRLGLPAAHGRQGVLVAQPFDAKTLKTTGDARPLGDEPTAVLDPSISYTAGHTTSVSKTGALAYFSGPPADDPRHVAGCDRQANGCRADSAGRLLRPCGCRRTARRPCSCDPFRRRSPTSSSSMSREAAPCRCHREADATRRRNGRRTGRASSLPATAAARRICT